MFRSCLQSPNQPEAMFGGEPVAQNDTALAIRRFSRPSTPSAAGLLRYCRPRGLRPESMPEFTTVAVVSSGNSLDWLDLVMLGYRRKCRRRTHRPVPGSSHRTRRIGTRKL